MKILGCLLMVLLVGAFMFIGVVRLLLRSIWQFFFPSSAAPREQRGAAQDAPEPEEQRADAVRPKIFEKDESEYVDFEEINEPQH